MVRLLKSLIILGATILLTLPLPLVQIDPTSPFPVAQEAVVTGTIYYVATTGADTNSGTQTSPWRTIQHAADLAGAGDSIFVRAGIYHEDVILGRSGSPGNPIAFLAFPGETVILDGGNVLSSGFETDYSAPDPQPSDISIDGFTIRNYRSFGIVAWSINDRLSLTHLVIQDNGGEGIRLSNSRGSRVQYVLLQHNEGGFDCTPILPGTQADPGCTDLYIGDARAIDNGTQGDTGTDAFAVEKGANILVERSLATGGPGDGFDFKSDGTTLSQVIAYRTRNNIKLWGQGSTLINALAFDATADANMVLAAGGSYTITNVTLANMTGYAYLATVGDNNAQGTTPVRLHNTIFNNDNPANGGTLVWFGPDVNLISSDYNLYYNPYRTDDVICAEFSPFNGRCFSDTDINNHTWNEPHSRYANPLFTNPAAKDFHLQSGSPAIDAGTLVGAPTDALDGFTRVNIPDIGPYEFGSACGDFNQDEQVGTDDIQSIAGSWRTPATGGGLRYDLDHDSQINIVDIMIVVAQGGLICH